MKELISSSAYTPATINNVRFRIPLYQRPYAWETLQIEQLLKDLLFQFQKNPNEKYYVGILNVGNTDKESVFDLIDGQQRITTLCLIGIVLSKHHNEWSVFLDNRLDLYGRKEDQLYLFKKDKSLGPNPKLVEGIESIEKFIDDISNKNGFSKYVYNNAAFFISIVPSHYTLIEKNLQFVRMNYRGKQLESHDVLKIKLASLISSKPEMRDQFIVKWNKYSQLGCSNANNEIQNEISLLNVLNSEKSISEPEKEKEIFYQSIVTYTGFLLIALERYYKRNNIDITVSYQKDKQADGLRKDRLLEEFGFGEKSVALTWDEDRVIKFGEVLDTQFDLYNKYIIKRDKEEKYKFKGEKENSIDEKENLTSSKLLELQVFQSFLYVTREPSQNNWLVDTFDYLEENTVDNRIDSALFLDKLKYLDNERCKTRNLTELEYPKIDRYWFWRLDYYLWENRKKYYINEALEVADKYIFRLNRSIEHIAPQTPKNGDLFRLDSSFLNCFGNLTMISSGQNSSLQNESYEVKRAHVEAYINKSKSGTIENLKMLDVYNRGNSIWDERSLKEHSNKMINILMESFNNNRNYIEITNSLRGKLYSKD